DIVQQARGETFVHGAATSPLQTRDGLGGDCGRQTMLPKKRKVLAAGVLKLRKDMHREDQCLDVVNTDKGGGLPGVRDLARKAEKSGVHQLQYPSCTCPCPER